MTYIPTGTPTATADLPHHIACITYLLRPDDLVVEAISASADCPLPTATIGHSLMEHLPGARATLTPLLRQVADTGLPIATHFPATDEDQAVQCVCTAQRDDAGEINQIACTLMYSIGAPMAQRAEVDAAITRIRREITTEAPLHSILNSIADAAQQLVSADRVQIALIMLSTPHDLRCEVDSGAGQADLAGWPFSHRSLARRVLDKNVPQRFSGSTLTQAIRGVSDDAWLRQRDVRTWVGVPLRVEGQTIGVIMAQRIGESTHFDDTDEACLQSLTEQMGVTIATRRLREAEADHAQRETVLGHLLDNLPVGVIWVDAELRILYLNEAQQRMRAQQRMGDFMPIGPGEFHPMWRDATTRAPCRWEDLPFIRTIRTGQSIEAVLARASTTDDEDAEFLIKTHPFHDAQGNVTDVIVVWVDVTEQRRASRASIRRAAELDIIIESIADGVIIYNREGAPLRYNPAALEILGWKAANIDPVKISAAERFDTYDLRFTSGELVPPEQRPVARALAGEITAPQQLISRRADNAEVVKSVRAAPLREPTTGAIQGAVIVFRDVTETQRVEQMKEDFINIASHELRAPLEPLMLASGFIKRWVDRPEHARDVIRLAGEITTHTRRISRLVAEMLDMTRITSEHFFINAEPSDLARTILDAIDDQQTIWRRTITTTGLDRSLICMADSERIWQVLSNLLSNAIKYSAAPTPIMVQATVIPPTERDVAAQVRIMVRDRGNGIAREHLPYIFSRFYRIMRPEPPEGTQMRDGLGLGLFISHAIITAHNGQIWAESEPGIGSSFYIQMPMCAADESGLI